jgi:hypothetical protein
MWTRNFSKVYKDVNRQEIWRIWTDVANWPAWHGDLDACQMSGEFKAGNHFMLKPKGVKPIKIVLTEVDPGRAFTDCTSFPGAKMYDTHTLEETPEGLKLSNTVMVTGPLKWLWVMLVAKNVTTAVPDDMEALVALSRKSNV